MNWVLMKKRDFRLFLFGNISSVFGDVMFDVALALYVLQITGSAGKFGATLALGMVPHLLLGFFSGALVDRMDKKKLVVFLDGIRGIILFITFGLYLSGNLSMGVIYVLVLSFSVCEIFFAPAYTSILPSIVGGDELVQANSLNKVLTQSANIFASVIAAFIFGIWGIGIILIVDGITFLVSAFVEGMMDVSFSKSKKEKENLNVIKDIVDGFKVAFKSTKITSLVVNGGVTHLFLTPFMAVGIPFILEEVVKVPGSYYGIVNAFKIVGSVTAGILVTLVSKKVKPDRGINLGILGMIVSALMFIPLGFQEVLQFLQRYHLATLTYMSFVNFCMFFSFGFYGVYFVSVYQRKIPTEFMGRFITMFITIISTMRLIGYKFMGDMFDRGNIMFAVLVLIAGMGIKLLVHIPYMRSSEDEEVIDIDLEV